MPSSFLGTLTAPRSRQGGTSNGKTSNHASMDGETAGFCLKLSFWIFGSQLSNRSEVSQYQPSHHLCLTLQGVGVLLLMCNFPVFQDFLYAAVLALKGRWMGIYER